MARQLITLLLFPGMVACSGGSADPCTDGPQGWTWTDADGDGFGAMDADRVWACLDTPDIATVQGDCDDADPAVNPAAVDACDGIDNDCDAQIDEGQPTIAHFPDADGDGFGDSAGEPILSCAPPDGHSAASGDCNDADAAVNPDAIETCNGGIDDDCNGLADDEDINLDLATATEWHDDADGDSFGDPTDRVVACEPPTGWIADGTDCNDAVGVVNPSATEVCNGADDDCDGLADDDDPGVDLTTGSTYFADADYDGVGDTASAFEACALPWGASPVSGDCDDADPDVGVAIPWVGDGDGDGYGDPTAIPSAAQCDPPGPGFTSALVPRDCNDGDPAINPAALEICNAGVDDDCDGLADDDDDWILSTSGLTAYPDADGDGFGNGDLPLTVCILGPGTTADTSDCDDQDPLVNPSASEICNGGIDDDCNGVADGFDAGVTPQWADQDQDGFGDPLAPQVTTCNGAENPDDCDDLDPTFTLPEDWYADTDGDGVGVLPAVVLASCAGGPTDVRGTPLGFDCLPDDPDVFPGNPEVCDTLDQDCDGFDECVTCEEWLTLGFTTDGVYDLIVEDTPYQVYCDMTTDGGGWTLVGSASTGLEDQAGPWVTNLSDASLTPTTNTDDIWDGLRSVLPLVTDLRFTCKIDVSDPEFSVDLSFYDVEWYDEITTGSDADSCFNENDGFGADPPPGRQNNLTGDFLPPGDPWNTDGYLEGEDSCGDQNDFTVDFDDRGMDGASENDGTDWGEDDWDQGYINKCATSSSANAFFLFVR